LWYSSFVWWLSFTRLKHHSTTRHTATCTTPSSKFNHSQPAARYLEASIPAALLAPNCRDAGTPCVLLSPLPNTDRHLKKQRHLRQLHRRGSQAGGRGGPGRDRHGRLAAGTARARKAMSAVHCVEIRQDGSEREQCWWPLPTISW